MRGLLIAAVLAAGLTGCGGIEPNTPAADARSAKEKLAYARRLKRACASTETYDRLKAFAFDEAAKIRRGGSPLLDRVAAAVTVRMIEPVAKSRDEQLDVTVCEGHLVLDLPPGLEDAFDGDRRLEADVQYAAQAAVDGSGLVYQMQGAEPIIYRLAALGLRAGAQEMLVATAGAPAPLPTPSAAPEPAIVAAVPPPPVVASPRPPVSQPAPRPSPRAAPSPRPSPTRATPPRVPRATPPRATPTRPPRAAPTLAPRPAPTRSPRVTPLRPPRPVPPARAEAPRATARPAFNCRVARGRVERMICSDQRLAAQDRRMSSAFYAALADGDGETRAALRDSRDRFLAFRNRCPTAACVSQAYEDRMEEIADIAGY